jgi:hypothetical protein
MGNRPEGLVLKGRRRRRKCGQTARHDLPLYVFAFCKERLTMADFTEH